MKKLVPIERSSARRRRGDPMTHEFPMVFHSQGVPLAARVFRNLESLGVRQPGVIAMGSWLTVKEQMATTYALRLAERGYTAFVFDFSGFGESAGDPQRENPGAQDC
jgi:hypothetical protein